MKISLFITELFVALSAIGGGLGLIFANGLGMPKEWLGGVFNSFLVPGLILLIIVGGSNLLAAIFTIKKSLFAGELSAVAGFGVIIWIFTELYITKMTSWMQILYFGCGVLILTLTLAKERYGKVTAS